MRPRPWAPGAPRDHAGRRTDMPRHMDESDDPTGMDEVDRAKFGDVGGQSSVRTISPEMKLAVELEIHKLRSWHPAPLDVDDAVSEIVDLWAYFPYDLDDAGKAVRIAQIEFVSNRLMAELGEHEVVAFFSFREKFKARFGDHLSEERVD